VVEKAYGLEIPQSLEEACDPTRTALLVYDMQVGIIGQLKNGLLLPVSSTASPTCTSSPWGYC
jgi:hypothetical protein